MKEDVKKKWVTALRSGDYEQAKGRLKTKHGMCCLGVLCELYRKEHPEEAQWKEKEGEIVFSFFLSNPDVYKESLPPLPVYKWAGLPVANPRFNPADVLDDTDEAKSEKEDPITLSSLNDGVGSKGQKWYLRPRTFDEIATIIEDCL